MKKNLIITFLLLNFLAYAHFSYSEEPIVEELPTEVSKDTTDAISEEPIITTDSTTPTENSEESLEPTAPTEVPLIIEPVPEVVEEENNLLDFFRTKPHEILKERIVEKKITLDTQALHFCEASPFMIHLSGDDNKVINVVLRKDTMSINDLFEIGSLPRGIDVTIEENNTYSYVTPTSQTNIALRVHRQEGAQEGSFNIPLIFTSRVSEIDSVVVCQINIISND